MNESKCDLFRSKTNWFLAHIEIISFACNVENVGRVVEYFRVRVC